MKRPEGEVALDRVRDMRRFSTDVEKLLWSALRGRQLGKAKFRRQVWLGAFIVDFYCAEAKLIIEADGGQHVQSEEDARRTAWLAKEGIRVIRFWNNDVIDNLPGVLERIVDALTLPPLCERRAPPSPLKGEG